MKAIGAIVGAALVFSAANPAKAVFDTGNDLYGFCRSNDIGPFMLCLGLVSGYYEAMGFSFACQTDPKTTREQFKDVVVKFLAENPAERHRPAAILAMRSYVIAFGCKKIAN